MLSISPSSYSVAASGGVVSVRIVSNGAWSVSSNQSWVTLSVNSGSGDENISVFVAENSSINADEAVVTFTAQDGKKATLQISRAGAEPIFSISPTNNSVDADGGVVVLSITTNMLWSASANQSWVD